MINIDTKTGIKKITGTGQRLVYMGKHLIDIIEGTAKNKTWTKQEVEELATEKLAKERVAKLKLVIPEDLYITDTIKSETTK
ncbi:hypothetical protein CW696_02825 [ANME-2 cluster archaeon]|nr:MAG: hypothetical protein CW696_02825 [ANME-2 cluster archaeon]